MEEFPCAASQQRCYVAAVQGPAQADAATQAQSPSQSAAHKSAISALYLPSHVRSRRASSLAPGPDTPSATPLRDPLHGSETGPRVLWRTTAAMFHAHARRFSSSSTADRLCDRRSETGFDQELSMPSQSQRIDSNDSAALSYADVTVSQAVHEQQHQQPGLHKDSHTFDSSVNLTPQSVISALYGEDISARTTPSEIDQPLVHQQPGTDSQRPSLDKSTSSTRTSADYVAKFAETVAQLAASQQLEKQHQCSSFPSKMRHRVRRTLSHVAQAPHVTKPQASARNYVARGPYSHDPRRPYIPMPSSPTWAVKRKNFQQMVPHSAPTVAARIQAADAEGADSGISSASGCDHAHW